MLKFKLIDSPVGMLKLVGNDKALVAVLWDIERPNRVKLDSMIEEVKNPLLLETEKQLKEYFKHQRKVFSLPIETAGTLFQKSIWNQLNQIPFGKTYSYKEIAQKIDNPQAIRAVGTAIGRNPISIIIPCHRVIATNGTLAGFAGGLDRKQILLNLENQ